EEVRQHRFREDLYFRLVVIAARLPPLRERVGDVQLLAHHFLDLYCNRYGKQVRGINDATMRALDAYDWPGNVRELENEIQRLVTLSDEGATVDESLLSAHIRTPAIEGGQGTHLRRLSDGVSVRFGAAYDEALNFVERALVEWAFERGGGVV